MLIWNPESRGQKPLEVLKYDIMKCWKSRFRFRKRKKMEQISLQLLGFKSKINYFLLFCRNFAHFAHFASSSVAGLLTTKLWTPGTELKRP